MVREVSTFEGRSSAWRGLEEFRRSTLVRLCEKILLLKLSLDSRDRQQEET